MLTALTLSLGLALSAAVLKAPPRPLPVLQGDPEPDGWHPSVPASERYESVTVLPYHPDTRTVRIVEHCGHRRELVYQEPQ